MHISYECLQFDFFPVNFDGNDESTSLNFFYKISCFDDISLNEHCAQKCHNVVYKAVVC